MITKCKRFLALNCIFLKLVGVMDAYSYAWALFVELGVSTKVDYPDTYSMQFLSLDLHFSFDADMFLKS